MDFSILIKLNEIHIKNNDIQLIWIWVKLNWEIVNNENQIKTIKLF